MRDPLFSAHVGLDGGIHLYLEERDANLDLAETVATEVGEHHLKALKATASLDSLKTMDKAREADFMRSRVPDFVTRLAVMTEPEALDLVEMLLLTVRHARALNNKQTKISLRVVK